MKALVFDFGNVLMFTIDYTPRSAWDERLNLPPGSVERAVHNDASWLQAQTGAISMDAYWRDVADRLNLTPEQTQQLAHDFYSGDALDAALVDAIGGWKRRGVTVGLLSNDSVELRPKLERLGIVELFDPLVISGEIGVMKPSAGAYRAVLDALPDYAPHDVVFIDDRAENIDGARSVGMVGVHYRRGDDLIGRLTEFVGAPFADLR